MSSWGFMFIMQFLLDGLMFWELPITLYYMLILRLLKHKVLEYQSAITIVVTFSYHVNKPRCLVSVTVILPTFFPALVIHIVLSFHDIYFGI